LIPWPRPGELGGSNQLSQASTSTSSDESASVADIRKTLRQLRNAIDGLESATGSPNLPNKNLQDLSRALTSAVDAFEILTSGVWEAIATQIIESKKWTGRLSSDPTVGTRFRVSGESHTEDKGRAPVRAEASSVAPVSKPGSRVRGNVDGGGDDVGIRTSEGLERESSGQREDGISTAPSSGAESELRARQFTDQLGEQQVSSSPGNSNLPAPRPTDKEAPCPTKSSDPVGLASPSAPSTKPTQSTRTDPQAATPQNANIETPSNARTTTSDPASTGRPPSSILAGSIFSSGPSTSEADSKNIFSTLSGTTSKPLFLFNTDPRTSPVFSESDAPGSGLIFSFDQPLKANNSTPGKAPNGPATSSTSGTSEPHGSFVIIAQHDDPFDLRRSSSDTSRTRGTFPLTPVTNPSATASGSNADADHANDTPDPTPNIIDSLARVTVAAAPARNDNPDPPRPETPDEGLDLYTLPNPPAATMVPGQPSTPRQRSRIIGVPDRPQMGPAPPPTPPATILRPRRCWDCHFQVIAEPALPNNRNGNGGRMRWQCGPCGIFIGRYWD
jgi:hypothetical protein